MSRNRKNRQNSPKSRRNQVLHKDIKIQDKSGYEILKLASLMLVVCVLVGAAHWPTLSAEAYSIDDFVYVGGNPLVQNPSWNSVRRFLTEVFEPSSVRGYYHPITMISLMLDCAMGGGPQNPGPFRITNLALHISNTALVIVILYLLFGQFWIAGALGLLFGLHPMTVEPVTWVTERKTLLDAFFILLSLIFYVWYTRKKSFWLYGISLVAFVLALMSKPTGFPVPILMLILDYWPLQRFSKKIVIEKLPFFIIAGISVAITFISQGLIGGVRLATEHGMMRTPLVICHNIVFYLNKIIWPVKLSSYYPFPEPFNISNPVLLWSVVGTFVLVGLLLVSYRWSKAIFVGLLFYLAALFPTLGTVRFAVAIAYDKYVYLPSLGLLMILTWFFNGWWGSKGKLSNLAIRRTALILTVVLIGVSEVAATRRYLVYWQDTETLMKHMVEMAPKESYPRRGLASVLFNLGRIDDAMKEYQTALMFQPDDYVAHYGLAGALAKKNEIDQAVEHYIRSITINPNFPDAHSDLGAVLLKKGKVEQALEHFRKAVQLKPDSQLAWSNLAWILATSKNSQWNNPAEALTLALKACEITYNKQPDMLDTLAVAYAANGEFDKAIETAETAIVIAFHLKNDVLVEQI
ncbi:MAG: tetratricopeptide repeat protein, partial [Planctomycetota bacterium]